MQYNQYICILFLQLFPCGQNHMITSAFILVYISSQLQSLLHMFSFPNVKFYLLLPLRILDSDLGVLEHLSVPPGVTPAPLPRRWPLPDALSALQNGRSCVLTLLHLLCRLGTLYICAFRKGDLDTMTLFPRYQM